MLEQVLEEEKKIKSTKKKKMGVKIKENPFAFPSDRLFFAYNQWLQERKKLKKISGAHPQESRKSLVGDDIFEEYSGPPAMTDIDPGYFTDLNGRPIREKFSSKRYIEQARQVLRGKIIAGYFRDECMRIDQEFLMESKKIADIEKNRSKYAKLFEEYLSNDHEESMRILNEAQSEAKNTNDLILKRDELSKSYGQVRLEVYQAEEMWRVAKACHDFLDKVSPKDQRRTITSEDQKSLQNLQAEQASLETLIEVFERDIESLKPREITLTDPRELSRIFSDMELRNLDALIHLESLAGPKDDLSASMARAEELVGKEIKNIEDNLQELKDQIYQSEKRAENLEKYVEHLLHNIFKQLVCSEFVLHVHVFIEDAYETCIGPNDASLDGYTMMKTIEKTYEKLNMTLDNLPHDIVRVCEREGFNQEMRAIREAEDAARKFELMHRLLAALERIMSPTKLEQKIKPNLRSVMKKNKIIKSMTDKVKKKIHPLGFFNDECDDDDEDDDLTFETSIVEKKNKESKEFLGEKKIQVVDENNCDCRNEIS